MDNINEEKGFSQTTIGLKPGRKKTLYPLPEGSGNTNFEHSEFIIKGNQSLV